MAHKEFELDGVGTVKIYKRRGNRTMRLSVSGSGDVTLSMPAWMPYAAGLSFASSRSDWLLAQKKSSQAVLLEGQIIGKRHKLMFVAREVEAPTSRIRQDTVTVSYPLSLSPGHESVQQAAANGSVRALRLQAEDMLPPRLSQLAAGHGFAYKSIQVKKLKSRWGSCDHDANIVLNLFLMQLPWELIDYVLLHELTHTKVLRHGPPFWQRMQTAQPNVKELRKRLGSCRPALGAQPAQ